MLEQKWTIFWFVCFFMHLCSNVTGKPTGNWTPSVLGVSLRFTQQKILALNRRMSYLHPVTLWKHEQQIRAAVRSIIEFVQVGVWCLHSCVNTNAQHTSLAYAWLSSHINSCRCHSGICKILCCNQVVPHEPNDTDIICCWHAVHLQSKHTGEAGMDDTGSAFGCTAEQCQLHNAINTYSHMKGNKHQKIISWKHGGNGRVLTLAATKHPQHSWLRNSTWMAGNHLVLFESDFTSYHSLLNLFIWNPAMSMWSRDISEIYPR